MVIVSYDFGVICIMVDWVMVMWCGCVVEEGLVD